MNKTQTDDMLPKYDLEGKKGVRGKYAKALQKGYSVRVVKEDRHHGDTFDQRVIIFS